MQASNKYDKTHQQILDAAVLCYGELGLNKTSMRDIAAKAEIGRTTLYRHFKSQNEVLLQAVMRDINRVLEGLTACLDSYTDLEDKIVEGLLFCRQVFGQSPVLKLLFSPESTEMFLQLGVSAEQVRKTAADLTRPIYDLAQAEQRLRQDVSLAEYVEWLTRILISLQTFPGYFENNLDTTRQFLRKFLLPSVITIPSDKH